MSFPGFGPTSCAFFAELAQNNNRDWFIANKSRFETDAKAPMAALLDLCAEAFGGTPKIFRQNRDTRFSKNKAPYKTALYGGVYSGVMGYYACLDADGFFAGMGVYALTPAQLSAFRAAVAAPGGADLQAALTQAQAGGVTLEPGAALKRAPRGYGEDHPRIDLLRRKNLILGARIPVALALDGEAPLRHAMAVWRATTPVGAWMNAAIDGA